RRYSQDLNIKLADVARSIIESRGKPVYAGAEYPELFGQTQLGFFDLFDIDVFEGDNPHLLDEPGGPVHVPDPRVGQPQFEVDLAVGVAGNHLDTVCQIEAPLGFYDVAELSDDVFVFAVQR